MSQTAPLRLIVLRHAKSAWPADTDDHDRPLSARGRVDAPTVGQRLRALGWVPDVVVSSDALRTRETWEALAPALGAAVQPRLTGLLYHAGLAEVRATLPALAANARTALVLGHNPGWEQMASALSGEVIGMTPANAVLLEHPPTDWGDALTDLGGWRLVKLLRPDTP